MLALALALVLGGDPFRPLTFDQALAAAAEEKRVVLIDFFTTCCVDCERIERWLWADEDVRAWLAGNAVSIRIDASIEKALAERFSVSKTPAMVFAKADGAYLGRIVGFRDSGAFLEEAASAQQGVDPSAREEEGHADLGNDPMARGNHADDLVREGRYEEALAEYLWCYDHGLEHSFGYGGVRLSFLLGDIAELGETYPPALEALRERRDRAEERLFATAASKGIDAVRANLAQDAAALCDELEGAWRVVALYDRLRASGTLTPAVRSVLRHRVLDPLIEKKRYADALETSHSPEAAVDEGIRMHRFTQALRRGTSARQRARGEEVRDEAMRIDLDDFMRSSTVEDGAHVYEAMVGTAQLERAQTVATKLIEFAPSGETYAVLIGRAARAGATDAARALAAQGLAKLPDAEHGAIRAALADIATAEQGD